MQKKEPLMSGENAVISNRVIYTPADFAKNNLIYLQEVGTLSALRVHESQRSELSSYLFFMVLKGGGSLTVEGSTYDMKAGDCAFVDCVLNYKHKTSENLWQLKWVHFNGSSMTGIYEKYKDRGGRYVFTPDSVCFSELSSLLSEIQNTASASSYIRDMEINEKLTRLLTELMRNSWNPEREENISEKRKHLQNVREYLDTHYSEDVKLDNLAQIFYINKYYLLRIFKEQYGTTVNKYLTQVRITNAKKHLRFTSLSVEQIGAKCGYSDTHFFIRVFKHSEGMTPGEFRKKWRA